MDTMKTSRTRELCAYLAGLRYAVLPVSTVERVKDLLLDHLGVALHSADFPWTRIVRAHVERSAGKAESRIYGTHLLTSRDGAALVNGTAAHGIGLDDTHDSSFCHPGAVVIPATLAVAEATQANAEEFIAALVVGYEAMCRVGAASHQVLMRGFHPTATCGVFGAAAATASLLKLNALQMESALGVAETMASGVMQFAEDGENNMVKRIFAGMPARNGILAAELVAGGLSGPRASLDGRFGFISIFAGGGNAELLTADLGTTWTVDGMSIKLYACCRFFHSAIDALRSCQLEGNFQSADVESVVVLTTRAAMESHVTYRPESVMAAQYSWPYAIAATLLLNPEDPLSFGLDVIGKPELVAMMDRVTVLPDPEMERHVPSKMPGGVRVKLRNGQSFEATRLDSVGSASHPVDRHGIIAKFRSLTSRQRSAENQDVLIRRVMGLGPKESLSHLLQALGAAT